MSRFGIARVAALVAIVVVTVSAVFAGAGCSANKGPIKIGMVVGLTGAKAFESKSQVAAAQMAIDEVNAAGGVLGRQVVLVTGDSMTQPSEGISVAEKLITQDKVSAILSSDSSSVSKAIMAVGKKYGVPMVATTSTAPDLTKQGNEFFFRVVPNDAMLAAGYAEYLAKTLGLKNMGFLVRNDDWGRQSGNLMKTELEARGCSVPAIEVFTAGDANYLAQMTKLVNLKIDGIFIIANAADTAVMVKEANELGFRGTLAGLGSMASDVYIKMAGELAEGNVCANQYVYTIPGEANERFVRSFTSKYPDLPLPDKNAWGEYTGTTAIIQAIKLARSDDPGKIREALTRVKFEGITGEISFDSEGQAHPNVYITVNRNGKPEVISTMPTD